MALTKVNTDLLEDGGKLDGIEALADVTDTANVTAAGALMDSELTSEASVKALNQGVATTDSPTFAGLTTSADINFGDNDKAVFGAGSDLQIYHDGSNSFISDQGTGHLKILAGDFRLNNAADNAQLISAVTGAEVNLFYNNALKLATTASGVHLGAGSVNATLSTESAGTSNLTLGVNAGNSIASGGNYNTVVGDEAGTAITTGVVNTFVGYSAGASVTTADSNTLVGEAAGDALTVGADNTALGRDALGADTQGSSSIAIGRNALASQNFTSPTSAYNVAIGRSAGAAVTTGIQNTLIGGLAGDAITTANDNVAIGYGALTANTTGSENTAVGGYNTLGANTTGANNVAVGRLALTANTTASNNTAVGRSALESNTTGDRNVAVGTSALDANTTADGNTAVGYAALRDNTTAEINTGLGFQALKLNTTGSSNVGVGANALSSNTTASNNTAVGYSALTDNTTGTDNVAIGFEAGKSSTTANSNTFVGRKSGTNATGGSNTFLGEGAGFSMTSGTDNTFVGQDAGSQVTGQKNTFLGCFNGNQGGLDIRTANNNIVLSDGDGNPRFRIDNQGRAGLKTSNSALIVGADSTTTSLYAASSVSAVGIYGHNSYANGGAHLEIANDSNTGWAPCYVNKFDWSSGKDARWMAFFVNGGADSGNISYDGTNFALVNASDYRLKENVVSYTGGLEKINAVGVKSYNKIDGVSSHITQEGFIAHELKEVIPLAVIGEKDAMKTDESGEVVPDYQTVNREALIPYLVSAVQELSTQLDAALARIETLEG